MIYIYIIYKIYILYIKSPAFSLKKKKKTQGKCLFGVCQMGHNTASSRKCLGNSRKSTAISSLQERPGIGGKSHQKMREWAGHENITGTDINKD